MPAQRNRDISKILEIATPLAMIALFFVVILAAYTMVLDREIRKYMPGGSFHTDTEREIVQSRTAYAQDLEMLYQLYTTYGSGTANAVEQIIPTDKEIPSLFAAYERVAKKLKVGLETLDIVNVDAISKTAQGAREMTISLKFSNVDYERFKQLLEIFETLMRFTDVISFDLQPETRFANLMIKIYYYPEKK